MALTLLEPQSHMWGHTTQISSNLSPKRDWGSKGVAFVPASGMKLKRGASPTDYYGVP